MLNPFEKDKNCAKGEGNVYPDIERGASLVIPVYLYDEDQKPIVSDFEIYFTLKSTKFDYDYDDIRALIKREAVLGDEKTGRYEIRLSSKDTWLEPGKYYFDIMLKKGYDVCRLYSAETSITEAPSNRYQSDATEGRMFGEVISIGAYRQTPIQVKLPGTFMLNYRDLPLTAAPSYLLRENASTSKKQIEHFTSRMRFPLILERENFLKKFFSFDIMTPFNFRKENPLGEIKVQLEDNCLAIWSVPLKSKIKFFGEEIKELKVGESIEIPMNEDFMIRIYFENHQLIITGKNYGLTWPLMVEWFDFNE